jgi:hypothetical protein
MTTKRKRSNSTPTLLLRPIPPTPPSPLGPSVICSPSLCLRPRQAICHFPPVGSPLPFAFPCPICDTPMQRHLRRRSPARPFALGCRICDIPMQTAPQWPPSQPVSFTCPARSPARPSQPNPLKPSHPRHSDRSGPPFVFGSLRPRTLKSTDHRNDPGACLRSHRKPNAPSAPRTGYRECAGPHSPNPRITPD